jgi:transposase
MGYKKGVDRNQITMLPEAVDDFIAASSYVRFLDEFVSVFDLAKLGFSHGITAETGRPPYDPADLLKLYLYGFMNRLNSSRQLANACKTNLEVMWLLRRIEPDFRTISDFRKENGKAIRKLFRFFVKRIKELGVISGELVGIDGSKFAAVNSKDNNYSEKKLKKQIEHYDQRIKAYLRRLEENDASETETPELKEQLEQQLELVKQRQEKKKEALKELRESGQKQISTVDPDSKRMKAGDGTVVGYNVQATVEAEEKLIIDIEVTNNGNDLHELEKMATRAKEILERDSLKVAADSGYYRAEEVANCEKKDIETYVSKPNSPTSRFFSKNDFTYLKEEDCYRCRAGQKLFFRGKIREHGRWLRRYETNACKTCALRPQCTSRKTGNRRITRFLDEELLEIAQDRVNSTPQIRTLRKSIVEHPFGTLKRRTNGRFLTKGIFKVGTEAVLMALSYDLGRLFKILGEHFREELLTFAFYLSKISHANKLSVA